MIAARLPASLELIVSAFAAAIALGATLGCARAAARSSVVGRTLAATELLGRALPVVVLAVVVQVIFALHAGMPSAGMSSGAGFDLSDRLRHLLLPVVSLAVPFGAWSSVIFYDAFRPAAGGARRTIATLLRAVALTAALVGPALISASAIVEVTYAWPGLGREFFRGLPAFDTTLVAGCLLVYCISIAIVKIGAVRVECFGDGKECGVATESLSAAYFERLYAASDDPWSFATSRYEHDKYDDTLAALGPRYERGLEIGCSVGVLTRRLATRCAELLAVDIDERALTRARARCADVANVRFGRAAIPRDFPAGPFELVVVSEIAYYWSDADLALARQRIAGNVVDGGELLLVHFLPKVDDYVRDGDAVHDLFLSDERFVRVRGHRAERYRLDLLRRAA